MGRALRVVISTFLIFLVIPVGPDLVVKDLDVGVFYALAVSSLSVIGVLMAGWASANNVAYEASSFEPGGLDYRPMLTRVKLSNPDVIVLAHGGPVELRLREDRERHLRRGPSTATSRERGRHHAGDARARTCRPQPPQGQITPTGDDSIAAGLEALARGPGR